MSICKVNFGIIEENLSLRSKYSSMNLKSIMECERRSLERMKKYQLPNKFKKFGVGIIFISVAVIVANILSINNFDVKLIAKYGILVGLLIISISKEKIEDELMVHLRMQSYTFAFIAGVVITLLSNPLFNYIAAFISNKDHGNFQGVGDWAILWILLSVQVFYFEFLKRMSK